VVRSVAVAQDSRIVLVGDSQGRVHSLDDIFTVRETVQVCPVGESVDALEMYDSEASILLCMHGPNTYKDTKPYMSSLLVFNRVYRLEIVSHIGIFDWFIYPSPLLPCVNKYRSKCVQVHTVCNRGWW
jgi:hypothetical protein